MIKNIIETLVTLLDIFNNPIGISSLIIVIGVGIIMSIFSKLKTIVICIFSFLLITIIGLLACTIGNTADYLWIPIFFFPFVVILTIFAIVKWLFVKMKEKFKR